MSRSLGTGRFFFFQAEDGIRDIGVTGVQTCALPIYLGARGGTARAMAGVLHLPAAGGQALAAGLQARSAALRGLGGPGVTLDASDQVWADPSLPTERGYLNAVATGYDAGLAKAPLLADP